MNALPFDESASFSAPAAFGTYRVLHQTGSGVLGPVFRAFDPRADRIVAIKSFKLDLLPEDVVRLTDALRRLASAPPVHPAVVPIIEAGLEGTSAFVVMEYQTGETMDVLLRRVAPATIDEALPWLSRLAGALDAAAALGVGHGSLHPRDVFVNPDDHEVKVTGMGIVQALEAVGISAPLRRPYAAPERVEARWDLRADVYSLGVIAHELFTRRRPAGPGEQDGELAAGLPAHQRVQVRRVLAMALQELPENRYASGAAFIGALDAIASRERVSIAMPSEPEQPLVVAASLDVPLPLSLDTDVALRGPERADETSPIPAVAGALAGDVPDAAADAQPAAIVEDAALVAPMPQEAAADDKGASTVEAPRAGLSPPDDVAEIEPLALRAADEPVDREEPRFEPLLASDALLRPAPAATPIELDRLAPVAGAAPPVPDARRTSRRPRVTAAAVVIAALGIGVLTAYLFRSVGERRDAGAALSEPVAEQAAGDRAIEPPPPADVALDGPDAVEEAAEPTLPRADVRRVAVPSGRLIVRSDPAGAIVTIDGRLSGETPVTIRDLSLGTYLVQVARPGYIPKTERITLRPAVPARTLSFELAPGLPSTTATVGSIDVDSRPRGARVIVDGRYVGQAPLRVSGMRPGAHAITLELGGYNSMTRQVEVEAGKSSALRPTLESIK